MKNDFLKISASFSASSWQHVGGGWGSWGVRSLCIPLSRLYMLTSKHQITVGRSEGGCFLGEPNEVDGGAGTSMFGLRMYHTKSSLGNDVFYLYASQRWRWRGSADSRALTYRKSYMILYYGVLLPVFSSTSLLGLPDVASPTLAIISI